MSKVHTLPPHIVSKIAAGEVIERPSSVIKELIENSLDASSLSIKIDLSHAGKSLIHVKDTGTGIEPDDIERIFFRHSTSKIQNMEDLFSIASLGFRGEALYSVASIADVTLRSRTKSSDTGWEIHLRGGEKINLRPISMPTGTEIEIRELFFNTPARKKFLKADATELAHILNIIIPYTLLHPECEFSLTHNNKNILNLPPEQNIVNRLKRALNLKAEYLLETKKEFPDEDASVHLVLGDINIQRSRKDMQFISVNGRPVHNNYINFHINQAYKALLPPDAKPFFFLHLSMPPKNIDVNIHPTKHEVKIKNESSLIPFLRRLCEHTLMAQGKPKQVREISLPYNKDSQYERQITFPDGIGIAPVTEETKVSPFPRQEDNLKESLRAAHYVGTFLNKYLFFESGDSLIIIDQHAAQERITYELLIHQIQAGQIEMQHLLSPFIIPLSPQEKLAWENSKEGMENIGLQTTLWDTGHIALHTHPQLIKKPEIAVRNILAEEEAGENFDTDTIARRACRNSVMAGDKMALREIRYLVKKLIECKIPFACPHGRPTVIEIKDTVFEKQFLRK